MMAEVLLRWKSSKQLVSWTSASIWDKHGSGPMFMSTFTDGTMSWPVFDDWRDLDLKPSAALSAGDLSFHREASTQRRSNESSDVAIGLCDSIELLS